MVYFLYMEKMPPSLNNASENDLDNRLPAGEEDVFDITKDLGAVAFKKGKATEGAKLYDSIQEKGKKNTELRAEILKQHELKQWEDLRKMAELRLEASGAVQEVAEEILSKKRLAEISESPKETVARLRAKAEEAAAEDRMWKLKRGVAESSFTKRDAADAQQPSATKYEEPIIELTDEDIEVVEAPKPEVIKPAPKKNKKLPPPPSEIRPAA